MPRRSKVTLITVRINSFKNRFQRGEGWGRTLTGSRRSVSFHIFFGVLVKRSIEESAKLILLRIDYSWNVLTIIPVLGYSSFFGFVLFFLIGNLRIVFLLRICRQYWNQPEEPKSSLKVAHHNSNSH